MHTPELLLITGRHKKGSNLSHASGRHLFAFDFQILILACSLTFSSPYLLWS